MIALIHVRLQEQEANSVLVDYMLQNNKYLPNLRFCRCACPAQITA